VPAVTEPTNLTSQTFLAVTGDQRRAPWRGPCNQRRVRFHSPFRKTGIPDTARAWWKRARPGLGTGWRLVSETVSGFSKDHGEMLAAALAFYTLLSIAPLAIVAVAIAGVVLGEGAARQEISRALSDTMGPDAAATVSVWVDEARASGAVAGVVGFALLLFGASRVAAQLREALNQVWNVDVDEQEGFRENVRDYVKRRLFAFAMVLASGPLLLAVFASRAGLEAVGGWVGPIVPASFGVLQALLSLVLVAALTAVVFKLVPDTRIGWRSAWIGAALTSVLFNAGNYLIGLYLGRAGVTQTYGAAASVVVVLLWLYFSAQLFLLGAEFTQAYAARFGRGLSTREESLRAHDADATERARARARSRNAHSTSPHGIS
jgi:membrane protein